MGIVYADVRLSNMGKPELEEITANAIVDTGAIICAAAPSSGVDRLEAAGAISLWNAQDPPAFVILSSKGWT